MFDEEAFREAIINAFVHNLWISENSPMITVFNDRIEILSRGTLPPKQTLEGFFAGESVPVNQKLSDIFLQLHISERTGRGVPRITEIYGRETYEFRENSIVVTIPFNKLSKGKNVSNNTKEIYFNENSNEHEKQILDFCNEPKGILEIAEILGYKDKKTVRKYIKPLIQNGRLAMTIPNKPNSRNQKYISVR